MSLNKRAGYLAIISSVIVTAIVMTIALVFSSSNFFGRFDTQNIEFKSLSRAAAEACLEYAKLKLAEGAYGGNETVAVGNYTCQILAIETNGSQKIIKTKSEIQKGNTNLKLTVDSQTLKTISLEELTSF